MRSKDKYRLDLNEKLIALKKPSITNTYITNEGDSLDSPPQTIMGKPIIVDTTPRDGQTLVYDAEEKEWTAGSATNPDAVTGGSGTTAERPSTLVAADAGKYLYYDTDTQGFVVWTGSKWSDE